MSWCDNEQEHEEEGREEYRSGGYFGYDDEKERNRWSDPCAEAYMRGLERSRREGVEEQQRLEEEERRMDAERVAAEQEEEEY